MEKYKEYMLKRLDEFTNELTLEIMNKENVTSGDIFPEQLFTLNECCEVIVDILLKVVEQNKEEEE